MKLKPFNELIALSKEKLNEAMAPIRARMIKSKADLEMAKIDTEILTKETNIQETFTKTDIDFPTLIKAFDELALLERRKTQYIKILSELFPA